MADLDSRELARAAVNCDIAVQMHPYLRLTDWVGTAQSLVDEGLVPGTFRWPAGKHRKAWTIGQLTFTIARSRPPGMKGPASKWIATDWWTLRTEPADQARDWDEADDELTEKECDRLRFAHTPAGREERRRWSHSRTDAAFQSFRRKLLP